jgi:hypothetical protein
MNLLSEYFASRRVSNPAKTASTFVLDNLVYLTEFTNAATTSISSNVQATTTHTVSGVTTTDKLVWFFASDVAAVNRGYPVALSGTAANTVTVVWHGSGSSSTLATGTFYLFKVV